MQEVASGDTKNPLPASACPLAPAWGRPVSNGRQAIRVPAAIKVACFELSVQAPEFVLPLKKPESREPESREPESREPESLARTTTVQALAPAITAISTRARASTEFVVQAKSGRGKRNHRDHRGPRGTWSVFVDAPPKGPKATALSSDQFQGRLRYLGDFEALEEFTRRYGARLETTRNDEALRVFEAGIEPTWEDPANTGWGAGKWTVMCPSKEMAKRVFGEVLAAMCPKEGRRGVDGVNGFRLGAEERPGYGAAVEQGSQHSGRGPFWGEAAGWAHRGPGGDQAEDLFQATFEEEQEEGAEGVPAG